MKRHILLLLCTFTALQAGAHKPRFSGSVVVGTAIALDDPAVTPFTLRGAGHYNIAPRWQAGVGAGISCYEKTLIPVFGSIRFLLTRPRRFTPWLSIAAGYAFAPAKDSNGGFYANPSVGIQYAVRGRWKLLLGIGWEKQHLERLKAHTGSCFGAAYAERLRHNSLAINLGVLF